MFDFLWIWNLNLKRGQEFASKFLWLYYLLKGNNENSNLVKRRAVFMVIIKMNFQVLTKHVKGQGDHLSIAVAGKTGNFQLEQMNLLPIKINIWLPIWLEKKKKPKALKYIGKIPFLPCFPISTSLQVLLLLFQVITAGYSQSHEQGNIQHKLKGCLFSFSLTLFLCSSVCTPEAAGNISPGTSWAWQGVAPHLLSQWLTMLPPATNTLPPKPNAMVLKKICKISFYSFW